MQILLKIRQHRPPGAVFHSGNQPLLQAYFHLLLKLCRHGCKGLNAISFKSSAFVQPLHPFHPHSHNPPHPAYLAKLLIQSGEKKPYHTDPLVKGRPLQLFHCCFGNFSLQNPLYLIIIFILIMKLQIVGKILGNFGELDIFLDQLPVCLFPQFLIHLNQLRKILPAPGRDKKPPIYRCFNLTEVLPADIQIFPNCRMNVCLYCIFLPDVKIRLHINSADTIQGYNIKIPYRLIVFRRISCSHDDPALRNPMIAEGLSLKELEHGRSKGF